MTGTTDRRINIRIVLICSLANNLTMGLVVGTFGAMLLSNELAFGAARSTISFGMSALLSTLGMSALLTGDLVQRLTPRLAIAIGLVATAIAFVGLGLTKSLAVALAMWALAGFGVAQAAILGPVAIAAEHFPGAAGKVLGFINLPVVLLCGPWVVTLLLPVLGREGLYMVMAAAMIPPLVLVAMLPGKARRSDPKAQEPSRAPSVPILSRGDFWLLTLGIALIASIGSAYAVHAIPYARSRGLGGPAAAAVLSIYYGAGLVGMPFFGWLADRIGAPRTLAVTGIIQSLCWLGMAWAPIGTFLIFSAVLGAATMPLTPLHGTTMAQIFGAKNVGKAMGYSFAIKLPFLFGASPAVGYAYELMADYRPAFLIIAGCLVAAAVFLLAGAALRSRRPALVDDAVPL